LNPLVIAWVVLSVLGLCISGYLVRESWLDLRALGSRGNGRRIAAFSRFTREGLRVSVHLLYVLAGLGALNILPFLRPFIVPFLMWGNLVLVVNSLIDARTRSQLYATRGSEPELTRD